MKEKLRKHKSKHLLNHLETATSVKITH